MSDVVCSATHPIDLDDGRVLAPGESAVDVDTDHPHNRALILDGHLSVKSGMTPRVRHNEDLVEATAAPKNTKKKED